MEYGGDRVVTVDQAHTLISVLSLALLAVGATLAWGVGYGCLIVGGTLLAGVVYARTRHD